MKDINEFCDRVDLRGSKVHNEEVVGRSQVVYALKKEPFFLKCYIKQVESMEKIINQ